MGNNVGTNAKSGGRRFRPGDERGSALVETALVLPVLLMVFTAITGFGLVLNNFMVLTNAVSTGAQALAISRGQSTDPCLTASTAINAAAFDLSASSISLAFVIDGATFSAPTTTCASGAADMVQGATAQITATYPCTLLIFGMNPPCSLTTQTTEVIQ